MVIGRHWQNLEPLCVSQNRLPTLLLNGVLACGTRCVRQHRPGTPNRHCLAYKETGAPYILPPASRSQTHQPPPSLSASPTRLFRSRCSSRLLQLYSFPPLRPLPPASDDEVARLLIPPLLPHPFHPLPPLAPSASPPLPTALRPPLSPSGRKSVRSRPPGTTPGL